MPKRGRPPKPQALRKGAPIGVRLTPEMRARLESERTEADPPQTLSQVIEARLRESFDFDRSFKKLFGGDDYHYWLLRVIAELIVLIEYQFGRQFVKDRFTFDQVKLAIDTILGCFKPNGRSSPPERLTRVVEQREIKELGKVWALMALTRIELAPKNKGNALVLTEFLDPMSAGKHLAPLMQKSVIKELNEIWLRKQEPEEVSQ